MVTGTFQHYIWYFGSRNSSCSWQGLAQAGTAAAPQRDSWMNNVFACAVLKHEPFHNVGLQHAGTLRCPGGASFANDPNTCTYSEYGDDFDVMGGGCRHLSAWQKSYQGWFGGCNGVEVRQRHLHARAHRASRVSREVASRTFEMPKSITLISPFFSPLSAPGTGSGA
jgi:hypothetical protein